MFYPLQSFWAKNFLLSRITCWNSENFFLYNAGLPLWFYRLRQPSRLFWAKKYTNFLFQVQSFVQDRFNKDGIYLGANRGTLLLKEVGSGKMRRQRKKGEHCFQSREKKKKKKLWPESFGLHQETAHAWVASQESEKHKRTLMLLLLLACHSVSWGRPS